MFTWPTCPQELANILKNSKNELSAVPDDIPTKVLKSSPNNILVALSHVFNLSMGKSEFIDYFKLATCVLCSKKVIPTILIIIDQLVYYQIFRNCLKKLCIIDCTHF